MNKTTKAISTDRIWILLQFTLCSSVLLGVMNRDSQDKFTIILNLFSLIFMPIIFIIIMKAYWTHKRKNPEKPLLDVKPSFHAWHSFFIGFLPLSIFLSSISDENQFLFLKYVAGLALFVIWLSLFVNNQYRKEDLEMEKESPMDEMSTHEG